MKRFLLFLALALGAVPAHAVNDTWMGWRSTNVSTSDLFNVSISTFVVPSISSASIFLHAVSINNPATGSLKLFRGNNSTATATLYETIDTSSHKYIPFDIAFSSGLLYGKVGGADITIWWDFVPPAPLPNQREGRR